ncbi:MAG: VCBS repeat-containing protein [Cytophagaceae bacterium]|nr:VCBS repeat-containing protein [Cytophagaceae bacterium]
MVDPDRDGKLDFVLGGRRPEPQRLYWYQFVAADCWIRHEVGTGYQSDVGLAALDVDGDGWVDLVCSGVWYRNTGKPCDEPFQRMVFDDRAAGAHDVVVADMDGDTKPDVVVMGDTHTQLNGLHWYKIPPDLRQPWPKHAIDPGIHGAIAPAGVADLNGDGHPDVVRHLV